MEDPTSPQETTPTPELPDPYSLETVRARAFLFQKYTLWALTLAFILLAARVYVSLLQDWLGLLRNARQVLGIPASGAGPDWWLCAGLCFAIVVPALAAFGLYVLYRRHWNARLRAVWNVDHDPATCLIRPLQESASEDELSQRIAYIDSIRSTAQWSHEAIPAPAQTADGYERSAEVMLQALEKDISRRAAGRIRRALRRAGSGNPGDSK